MLNSIRIKFVRGDEVKYISHLDLMKVFERALRRARLPIAYSQGFNPHPQMVFGLPLSVGVSSEAEYADFELSQNIEPKEFMETLNVELPKGLRVVDTKVKNVKDNIMAVISMASYELLVSNGQSMGIDDIKGSISGFMGNSSVIVKKEGKKGLKDMDIRPLVHKLEICPEKTMQDEGVFCLAILVNAGSASNLRPDLLVSALQFRALKIHRTGLFITKGDRFVDPLDPAVL